MNQCFLHKRAIGWHEGEIIIREVLILVNYAFKVEHDRARGTCISLLGLLNLNSHGVRFLCCIYIPSSVHWLY